MITPSFRTPRTLMLRFLMRTCHILPCQWSGLTVDGDHVYMRMRHGKFRVECVFPVREVWFEADVDDRHFTTREALELCGALLLTEFGEPEDVDRRLTETEASEAE